MNSELDEKSSHSLWTEKQGWIFTEAGKRFFTVPIRSAERTMQG